MGKNKAQIADPNLFDLDETLPERDPLFMDYCSQVIDCASKRASRGQDCDICRDKEKCAFYFDRVSGLSARRRLTPDQHQYYKKQFLQLMKSGVPL